MKFSVLLVDDDVQIQTVVGHYLEDDGYKVICAGSGKEALAAVENETLDVVLLDIGLPDMDGLTVMNQIRMRAEIPIIVVSGKDDATDKIVGLEMGADDYVGKPFHLRELSARIKSVLRRAKKDPATEPSVPEQRAESIEFGDWIMNPGRFEVKTKKGELIDLTTGEFQLLHTLVSASNRVLSREQLFEKTRDEDYDSFDRAVDIQIGRLRKKLNDDPKSPRLIKTVRGVGYMFIGDVKKSA